MRKQIVAALCAFFALTVGVTAAMADGGGNSANAQLCQQGGWMNLQGSDGTLFANDGDCVSFGAQGGTIVGKCTAGSDNFSEDANGSQPTTFSGGTIDTPYGGAGSVRIQGVSWFGFFASGTHLIFTGFSTTTFHLTFTNPVASVQLDAEPNELFASNTQTLNAYDYSNNLVDTDAVTGNGASSLSVTSAVANIKSITIQTTDSFGVGFSNVVWGCP